MRFAKLAAVYKQLSASQRKRLSRYLRSPYFNEPPTALALFNYFESLPPTLPAPQLQPAAIARHQPLLKTPYVQNKASTLLLKAISRFAALEHWQQQPHQQRLNTLSGLKQIHWFEQYAQLYAQTNREYLSQPGNSLEHYQLQHYLTETHHNGLDVKFTGNRTQSIQPVTHTLDVYYAIKKLRYLCEQAGRSYSATNNFNPTEAACLLQLLQPYCNRKHPYVFLMVNLYHLLTSPLYPGSIHHYKQVKKYILQHSTPPLTPAVTEAINLLRHYCIKWSNRGVAEVYPEYLWNVSFMIEHRLFENHGALDPVVFSNLFNVAHKITCPPAQMQQFITHLSPLLADKHRKSRIAYANGIYNFALHRFTDAAAAFNTIDVKSDSTFTALAKRWYFKSTFESRPYTPGLDAILAAYERYLNRHTEIPEIPLRQFKEFAKYARKLLGAFHPHEKKNLIHELNHTQPFAGKDWLLEKLK
ncbi:MAG: hypothetical protein KIS94_13590 [Chitinophagales bacterium]|nr:hypothetical protein [Chitinophagales bacterium]